MTFVVSIQLSSITQIVLSFSLLSDSPRQWSGCGESVFELDKTPRDEIDDDYLETYSRWFISRKIPITNLVLTACPKGLISTNKNSLKKINWTASVLETHDCLDLSQCVNLKHLSLTRCTFPPNINFSSIYQNLNSSSLRWRS
jgi:hypothetical protein